MKNMNNMKKNVIAFVICIIVLLTLFMSSISASAGFNSLTWSPYFDNTSGKFPASATVLQDMDNQTEYIVVISNTGVAITPRIISDNNIITKYGK